jgi:hypothetical protein
MHESLYRVTTRLKNNFQCGLSKRKLANEPSENPRFIIFDTDFLKFLSAIKTLYTVGGVGELYQRRSKLL